MTPYDRLLAMAEVGRMEMPELLREWWDSGEIDADELRDLIPDAWVTPEWPLQVVGEDKWVEMFHAAGFVFRVDSDAEFDDGGRSRHRPIGPLTVYRGARIETAGHGMSWTLDLEKARWFAKRELSFGRQSAGVFRAVVPPEAVLGMFNARAEQEVVVDPAALPTPELVETTGAAEKG